ncbi:MAG: metallophosphoesterase [Candidatus Competibacteraceae bacterium]
MAKSDGPAPPPGAEASFTFAHLSDPHLSSLKRVQVRELLNQRILGYLSWRSRRRAEHKTEVLEALLRDLAETRPQHIVVTGDLTHLGLPGECREVSDWLHRVGAPGDVTVIPGNHDTYIAAPWEQTVGLWVPYMASDNEVFRPDPTAHFPILRIRGPVAFIGLSTAHPTPPFLASGSVGRVQLRHLEQLLVRLAEKPLLRVLLLHHPPQPEAIKWRKRLIDSAALRAILARHGAELVLYGHAHYPLRAQLATPAGTIPAIGVPSASALGHKPGRRAQYHLYRVSRTAAEWQLQISMRTYEPTGDRFVSDSEEYLSLPAAV